MEKLKQQAEAIHCLDIADDGSYELGRLYYEAGQWGPHRYDSTKGAWKRVPIRTLPADHLEMNEQWLQFGHIRITRKVYEKVKEEYERWLSTQEMTTTSPDSSTA